MKKLIALLLTLTIFSGIVPMGINVTAKAEAKVEVTSLMQTEMQFDIKKYAATPTTQALEDIVYSTATACNTSRIDISRFNYTVAKFSDFVNLCREKYPELYHLKNFSPFGYKDTNGNGRLDNDEKVSYFKFEYYLNASTYNTYNSKSKQAAAEMLADIKATPSLTDLQKLLLLHDRIAVRCEYDYKGYEKYVKAANGNPYVQISDYIDPESFGMYGTLVLGVSVCEGYARTYQYMLNELGIENYLCSSVDLCHVWNIVKLGGEYYHVDITFDDPPCSSGNGTTTVGTDRTGHVSHNNFLRSTEGIIFENHDANDFDTTPDDTTYDDYFWQDSKTAFTLLKGKVYYINNSTKKLMQWQGSNGARDIELYDVSARWGNYSGNYACLSGDKNYLYFNSNNTVYEYDIVNNTRGIIHELELASGMSIYGFKVYYNEFFCDIASKPNYYASEKRSNMHRHKYSSEGIDISASRNEYCENIIKDSVYTGNPITFPIDIIDIYAGGKHLIENIDFTVAYENNVNVGTATIIISGIGDYTGYDVETFKILPASILGASVTNVVDKTYTGSAVKQAPIVRISSRTLLEGVDYSLSYVNNVATGRATMKITGKGNYKGSFSKVFYIHPKKVEGIKVKKATATSITLNWNKSPSGTGYAVLCATSKNGTYKTVGLIESRSTTTFTHKKLSKNKTYYYKVIAFKTVNASKKTSVASEILTAKTATSTPKITYYKNSSKKAAKVKWGKVSGASGYQVYMKVSGGKYKRVYSGKKLYYTAKKLKKGKTYYFKVRTYKTSDKIKAYSSYSSVKKVKIQK